MRQPPHSPAAQILSEKPYRFVPPYHGRLWPAVLTLYLPRVLRKFHGITSVEMRHDERLKASLDAGHGVLLAPNHVCGADPPLMGLLSRRVGRPLFIMASWHLFMNGGLQAWLLRRAGAFSVYREGMDKAAVDAAIDILSEAKRPLIVFPEGALSRSNDALNPLMEGVALMARAGAKRRAKATLSGAPAKVVVHPVAIRYCFQGDLRAAIEPVLERLERRLTWRPRREISPVDRVVNIGYALLAMKEIEYIGQPQPGDLRERLPRLIDHLLAPLEAEWLQGRGDATIGPIARIKKLHAAIMPDLIKGDISPDERERRWRQLDDLYVARQISSYPPDYIRTNPTVDRLLETVKRFEEDLTGSTHPHSPTRAIVDVGEAIEVETTRDRGAPGGGDPLMVKIEEQIKTMQAALASEFDRPLENRIAP